LAAVGGNRAPTADESAAITADVDGSHSGYSITSIRIADSDSTWAALDYAPSAGSGQTFEEVRHLAGGTWGKITDGSAQVACSSQIPSNVQADFANLDGFGPC
jgi:hypothetical protein